MPLYYGSIWLFISNSSSSINSNGRGFLNAFVWIHGPSKILPPITIVEGIVLDYNLHFKVIFSEFVQTYKGTDNTMSLRTIDAIALG